MIYRNDTDAAIYACERARTGNYGDDEYTGDYYDREEYIADMEEWKDE